MSNRTNESSGLMQADVTRLVVIRFGLVAVIYVALYWLPGRENIAPQIIGDNVYIYMAADRLFDGQGMTSLPPVAPLQPWEYQRDWAWLTQWPMGYPLLLCAFRYVFGITALQAGQWLSIAACALGLVGWYTWLRRVAPSGAAGVLLSIVGAATAFGTASLIDPSTDTILTAMLPWALLSAHRVCQLVDGNGEADRNHFSWRWIGVGLLCGALVWIRYAAVFIPAAVGLYLAYRWLLLRLSGARELFYFAVGSALPIALLVAINSTMGQSANLQTQMNLGSIVGFEFSWHMFTTAWCLWTDLPFYSYKWYSHWFFSAIIPLAPILLTCFSSRYRSLLFTWLSRPSVGLSVCVVVSLLAMLMASTTLFKGKFDFIGLDRYYLPIQPLYFAIFIAPLLAVRVRAWRVAVSMALLFACSWQLQYEWPRPYKRWLVSRIDPTRYGRLATAFSPQTVELFDWVANLDENHDIIFSNFHDEIALETGIAALPLPATKVQFEQWMDRVTAARGLSKTRAVFVVDDDYHDRGYYLPALTSLTKTVGLSIDRKAPENIQRFVYIQELASRESLASQLQQDDKRTGIR